MQSRCHTLWVLCAIATMASGCWRPPTVINYVPLIENIKSGDRDRIPVASGTFIVRRGDTAYGIARCLNITLNELAVLNLLDPPYLIRVGQSLLVPRRAEISQCRAKVTVAKEKIRNEEGAESTKNNFDIEHTLLISPPAITDDKYAVIPEAPPRAGKKFLWPVKGEVISTFGPKPGKLRNDGINIAAPLGTIVRAAENGVVAYAVNELRGYGKMLLIRHQDGWITAYAHNKELLVVQGALVARGDAIALVGKSGSVDFPQTHFEIRQGEKAVNPDSHLSWK